MALKAELKWSPGQWAAGVVGTPEEGLLGAIKAISVLGALAQTGRSPFLGATLSPPWACQLVNPKQPVFVRRVCSRPSGEHPQQLAGSVGWMC